MAVLFGKARERDVSFIGWITVFTLCVVMSWSAFAACPSDTWGTDCAKQCSLFCQKGCRPENGHCISGCMPGRAGLRCDKKCRRFRYGPNCIHTCGHCVHDEPCDKMNGICYNGCVAGWMDVKCTKACPFGTYGENCLSPCGKCKFGQPCNRVTGVCTSGCKAGWFGRRCDKKCAPGAYGVDCAMTCSQCGSNKTCHHMTGECMQGCGAGWQGAKCDRICPGGYYGEECALKCGFCKNGSCDHVTGTCPHGCTPGWNGSVCKQRCPSGSFGEDCLQSCGRCLTDTVCEQVKGVCLDGCQSGWQGVFCDHECDDGYYGVGCRQKCGGCWADTLCDKINGSCPLGCKDGWTDSICATRNHSRIVKKALSDSSYSVRTPNITTYPTIVPGLVVAVVVLVLALVIILVYHLRIKKRKLASRERLVSVYDGSSQHASVGETQHVYEPLTALLWELDKSQFTLTREMLGNGHFGKVRKGFILKDTKKIPVAVKSLKENASDKDKEDFMNELGILKKLGLHPNVICLVGSCSIGETLYVALEYASNGDLRTFLRKSRTCNHEYTNVATITMLSQTKLISFALDAARGLEHLAEKQIIHRDVAARNILLDKRLTAKVADFGLSKNDDTYIKTSITRVPVRWMAIESLFSSTYTTKSDVWAFGVLLWEIVTLGGTPYPGLQTKCLYEQLLEGYRMSKPKECDEALYQVMSQCWQENVDCRPSFPELLIRLQRMITDQQVYMNLHRDEEYQYPAIESDKDDN